MSQIKWFSGGSERRQEAILLINHLVASLREEPVNQPLEKVLLRYSDELASSTISVPFLLSQMNVEVSQAILKHSISLTKEQSQQIKSLRNLSNIRFGY